MSRISSRLIGALVALFLCTAALSIVAWRSLNEQITSFNHVHDSHVVPQRDLKVISDRFAVDIVDAAHKARSGMFSMPEANKILKSALNEIDQVWGRYIASVSDAEERKLVESTLAVLQPSREAAETLIALTAANDRIKLTEFIELRLYAKIDPGTAKIGELIDFHLKSIADHYSESKVVTGQTLFQLLVVASIALVLTMLAGVYVYFGVVRNLHRQITAMNTMASGNLDAAISGEARKDEIGDMARALVSFRESGLERRRLREESEKAATERAERAMRIEKSVLEFEQASLGIVNSVFRSSEELHQSANKMLGIASDTSMLSNRVAAASTEVSQSMQSLASAGEELAQSIGEIGRQAEQSSSFASAAAAKAQSTDMTVKKLNDAGKAIGEVVDLIKQIAAQTNLLALNATIEAARAGESGRGFAVVAAEVKELATQTTRATDVIAEHVSAIQGAAGESIEAMRDITRMIGEINQVASSIAVAVTEQSQATAGISDNVQQVARGTEETTQTITVVHTAATDTDVAAREVMEASSGLASQSQLMREKVDEFLRNVRAA